MEVLVTFIVFFVISFLVVWGIRSLINRNRPVIHDMNISSYYKDHVIDSAETSNGSPVKDNYSRERYDSNGKRIV